MDVNVLTRPEPVVRQLTPAKRPIRLLQVGATLSHGGSEKVITTIGNGLDPQRFETVYAATGRDGDVGRALREQGHQTYCFDRGDGFHFSLYPKMWGLLRKEKIDIVQTHHVETLVYGGVPSRMLGVKLVHTEHDSWSFDQFPRHMLWLRRLAFLVHQFIVIDPSIEDFLVDRAGIKRGRIKVIRNGIDLSRFTPRPASHRLPTDPLHVGWVARMLPPKRPDLFVDALAILQQRGLPFQATVVGPGDLIEPTKARAQSAGIADKIEFVGGRHDIPDLLANFDCYVLCSDQEGLPISLVEAMATGLPCVASSVGGIPNLINHEHDALLLKQASGAELADHLTRLHQNVGWANELGANARRKALQSFDVNNTIAEYSEVFLRLMHSNPS